MKIYTEIIMQWDEDNEELVEVSSESHEYSGDVAQCGAAAVTGVLAALGGWGLYETAQGSGSKLEQMKKYTPKGEGEKWLARGVTKEDDRYKLSPVPQETPSGFGFDPRFVGTPFDVGTGLDPTLQSYLKEGVDVSGEHRGQTYIKPFKDKLKEAWYDPYMEAAVTDPLEQVGGVTTGAGDPTDVASFQTLTPGSTAERALGEAYQSALTQVGAYDPETETGGAILPRSPALQSSISTAAAGQAVAGQAKEEALEAADIAEEEALDILEKSKLEATIARKELSADIPQIRAGAEAEEAATGFAFSGPAAAAKAGVEEDISAQFRDITRGETQSEEAYGKALEDIDRERESTERTWKLAEVEYAKDLQDVYTQAGGLLSGLTNKLNQMVGAHYQFGEGGAGRIGPGGTETAVGAFGPTTFAETSIPEAQKFEERVGKSQSFLDTLEQEQAAIQQELAGELMG